MKKIRLFVDAHIFDKEPQGTRTFIKEIYKLLSEDNERFDIYMGAYNIDNLAKQFPAIKNENLIKFHSKSSYLRLGVELPYIIKSKNIELAHFQYIVPPIKYCKYLVTTHDILFCDFPHDFSSFYKKKNSFLFKRSIMKSDIITTVSSYSKHAIHKHFGIPLDRIHVLPNAVSEDYIENYDKREAIEYIENKYSTRNYILFVSRIEARKNHEFLLDAYLQLELYKEGIDLVFIGKNSIPVRSFENKLNSLPPLVKGSVHWFQSIEDNDLREFYRGARLFVYPSKAEGFGIPPLESIASQIETLCSNATAMSDFSFLGENRFDPNNLEELKYKMTNALRKKSNNIQLRKMAEFVKENYVWRNTANKLAQLILEHFSTDENSYLRN